MRIALFAAFICLAVASPSTRQVQHLNHPQRIPGEFLVLLKTPSVNRVSYAGAVAEKISKISSKISIVKSFTNLRTPIFLVKTTQESEINQLFQLHEVDVIESNVVEQMIQQCTTQSTGSQLWGLSRVSSRDLPNFSGATFSHKVGDGAGVKVYVLDTGIRLTHNDFGGRAIFGTNTVGGSDNDNNGHGTHCAGTVLGTQYGVAKGATAVAVKCLGDGGTAPWSAVIDGVNWAVGDINSGSERGVLSMSLGGGGNSVLDSAVNSAVADGIPVVTASGNNGGDACNNSPGRATGTINVGNTDNSDRLNLGSNWGTCVDILAPGTNILSASHLSDSGSRLLTGTSMACPHVAGLVAAYLAKNPSATPAAAKNFVRSTATPDKIDTLGRDGIPNLLMYSVCQ